MTSTERPEGALAATEPERLLPPRRAGEELRLRLPLRVVDSLALGAAGGPPWAALIEDFAGSLLGVPLVPGPGGVPARAEPGDGAAEALLRLLAKSFAAAPFEVTSMHPVVAAGERGIAADQTHDSVVVGDLAVVKWAVHVDPAPGPIPAVAALSHLDAVGFAEVPQPLGFLTHHGPRGATLLASAARYLPGARDGWDWYVDDLLDELAGPAVPPAGGPGALRPATELGGLVARLHLAFATPWSGDPEPVRSSTPGEGVAWLRRASGTLDEALSVTTGAPGRRLAGRADAARAALAPLATAGPTPLTRVHGDLHVGQVLRWSGGYALSDFDGNPVLPAAERASAQPPARDVAGMLRSLDHVGRIVDRRTGGALAVRVAVWIVAARAAFLDTYTGTLSAAGRPELLDRRLLLPFEVEQECRELVYAARHLPRWTYVPDAALGALLPAPDAQTETRTQEP